MLKYSLSALAGTALFAACVPALAQKPSAKPTGVVKAPSAAPQTKPIIKADDPMVASVNSKKILWSDVLDRMIKENPTALEANAAQVIGASVAKKLYGKTPQSTVTVSRDDVMKALRAQPTMDVQRTLSTMIQTEVVEQEAAKQGIKATNADIDAYLNKLLADLRASGQIPPEQTNAQFLASRNLSTSKLRVILRPQYLGGALTLKKMEKDAGHPFGPDDFVQARHILINVDQPAPDAKPEEAKKLDDAALASIRQISADIKSKKTTFEAAAKEHSKDPSGATGGDLGVFTHGMMVPEFDQTAFKLKPGELSEPVKTQFGYHLIEVTKKGSEIKSADREKVIENQKRQKFQQYLPELMATYKIVNKLQPAGPPMGGMPIPQNSGRPVRPPSPNGQ